MASLREIRGGAPVKFDVLLDSAGALIEVEVFGCGLLGEFGFPGSFSSNLLEFESSVDLMLFDHKSSS
jgi:hypothetical protein